MLKLEKLELKNGFTGTESLIKSGIALVAKGATTVASGNYMMHSSFGGVVAAINASGIVGAAGVEVFASNANQLKVQLFAIATQKFAVEANAGKTTLKLDLKTDGKHLVVIKNTTGKDPAFASSSDDTLELAEGATKGELVVEVKVPVAEGELEDTSISDGHKLSLTPGDVYMSMVARVADVPGNKENVTSFKLDGSSTLKLEKE